jgi:3D (Asp-Asp-Asp) domain-containing protein
MMRRIIAVATTLLAIGCMQHRVSTTTPPEQPPPVGQPPSPDMAHRGNPGVMRFHATAYSVEGKTASGGQTHEGIVAANPATLPLGSRIRVTDAGSYSGEYVVRDTGRKIDGNEIDIYLLNDAEAKRFGNRRVKVEVLSYGKGK